MSVRPTLAPPAGVVGEAAAVPGQGAVRPVDWRRNLAALWLAEFMAIFGFSFCLPFMPLYLGSDLGVHGASSLALWTGVIGGVSGLMMAIASPLWGWLGDRQGRRAMLLRAMLCGAAAVALMGLAQSPQQLMVLRGLQGATAGTVAAATALVAVESPRSRVAWALGVLSSSVAMGGAVAPLIGGLAAPVVGLRWVFIGGGILLGLSAIPVLLIVRETPRSPEVKAQVPGLFSTLGRLGRPLLGALAVLIGAQAVAQFAYSATQQMAVLHILSISPRTAVIGTGVAFAAAGLTTSVASVLYSRLTGRAGYRWVAATAAAAMGLAIVGVALSGSLAGAVVAIAVFGLFYGALSPTLSSLIGLRAPRVAQSTIFGVSASAIAIGFGTGPFIGGLVAAFTSVQVALLVAAGAAVALGAGLAIGVRNPA